MTFPFPFFVPAVSSSFPVIAATNTGNSTTTTASYNLPLPASIASGNLLIFFLSLAAANPRTFTAPSGWTVLWHSVVSGNLRQFASYYRVADGSEGSTLALTSPDGTPQWASTCYRITGFTGTPEAGTMATGSSAAANPPSLTASWGSQKNLFLAACATLGGASPASVAPSSYSGLITASATGTVPLPNTSSAYRELQNATDDPGAFTNPNVVWGANTVAIRGL